MSPSSLLYQLCPSWSWGWGVWKHSASSSRFRGSFLTLHLCPVGRVGQRLCHIPYLLLSTCWVVLACYFASLCPPVSSQALPPETFCCVEGLLRPPGSLLGLGCASVKPDWQQAVCTVHCFSPHCYFLSFQKWLFPGVFSGTVWSVNFHSSLLMLHLWGMREVGLIWQDQGLSPVANRPFVVSSGPHPSATQQILSCKVFSLPEPLAGQFWMVLLCCLSRSIRNWFDFWGRGLEVRWGRARSKAGLTSYSGKGLESPDCSPIFAYERMTS